MADARFVALARGAKYMWEQIILSVSGAGGLANNIPQSLVKKYDFVRPPLAAQRTIAQEVVARLRIMLIAAAGGGLGNIAVQLAKARGAKVVGLTSKSKFKLVRDLGADLVADYGEAGWSATIKDKIGEKGVQVYLDSIGDLTTEAFPLFGHAAQWIIFGVRSGALHPLPPESIFAMIEKNIMLRGFNLEGSLQLVPQALGALFAAVAEGKLKLETTKYPLSEAAKVRQLFEVRNTTGKVILVP